MKFDLRPGLVERLVAQQFPQWAGLPVRPVEHPGWDNFSFRLGEQLVARLPSAPGYAEQAAKERDWLPVLAPALPMPIPEVVAMGEPSPEFPYEWTVFRWLTGMPLDVVPVVDEVALATDLAAFLVALRGVDATAGPRYGQHSAWRGGPLGTWDAETSPLVEALGDDLLASLWSDALHSEHTGPPVWFHGDVAPGNLLVGGGALAAVIDFGCAGVGDPACDGVAAWTMFGGESREAFIETLGLDAGTWLRSAGWALWKAVISLDDPDPLKSELARDVLDELRAVPPPVR
jgi:aminoglycoside phosphotransferase (APT) family kinase protein